MAAERPIQIRIFGRVYDINYLDKLDGMQSLGLTQHNDLRINIQEGQHIYEERDTILHEALHAIDYASELGLTELQVTVLAHSLLGVFGDNPEFKKYILK